MSVWGEVFLGLIAAATLVMAIGQVLLLVAAGRAAKRMARVADVLDQELKPLFAQLNAVVRDASKAAALATSQVERADRLFADLVARFDSVLNLVQETVTGPLRQGPVFLAAFRAVLNLVRDFRAGRRRARQDEEDALFI